MKATLFLLLYLLVSPSFLRADILGPVEKNVVEQNRWISYKIDHWAESLDVYLANEKYSDRPNQTRVTIDNRVIWRENKKPTYAPKLSAKIHLPHTQKKWQLAFATNDDDETSEGIGRNRADEQVPVDSISTFVNIAQTIGRIKTEFQPRFQYTKEFETKYRLKFSSKSRFGAFEFKPEIHLFANIKDGTGQFLSLGLRWNYSETHHFELVNEQQYSDGNNTVETNHGPIWQIQHSTRMFTRHSLILEANNRPLYQASRYVAASELYYRLLKNVLHCSVTPIVYWGREERFKARFGLDFGLELIF